MEISHSQVMANSLHCHPNHIEYDHMVLMSISGEERYVYRIDVPGWVTAGATVVMDATPVPVVPECLWAWNDGLGELEGGGSEEPAAPVTGAVNTLSNGSLVGGSGYTEGTYNDVPLTGGTGSGARADIGVSGDAVTVVSLDAAGDGYTAGDVLSADDANLGGGGGSGFSIAVGSILNARGQVIYAGYTSRL